MIIYPKHMFIFGSLKWFKFHFLVPNRYPGILAVTYAVYCMHFTEHYLVLIMKFACFEESSRWKGACEVAKVFDDVEMTFFVKLASLYNQYTIGLLLSTILCNRRIIKGIYQWYLVISFVYKSFCYKCSKGVGAVLLSSVVERPVRHSFV